MEPSDHIAVEPVTGVDVSFVVTLEDAVGAARALWQSWPGPASIAAAVLGVVAVALLVLGNLVGALLALASVAVLLVWQPRFSFMDPWIIGLLARRLIGSQWRYEVGPNGIAYTSSLASGQSPWATVKGLEITNEVALLRTTEPGPHAIPLRTMSEQELGTIQDLVRACAPHAAVADTRR